MLRTNLASSLFNRIGGPRLQSLLAPVSPDRLCHSCAEISFESLSFMLGRSLEEIRIASNDCPLCQFFFRRLSLTNASPRVRLTLHRVGSTIRLEPNGESVISLYSNKGYLFLNKKSFLFFSSSLPAKLTECRSQLRQPRPQFCTNWTPSVA